MQSFRLILKSKEQQQNECLWDAVKDNCYADKPETIDALEDNIREVIGGIRLHTIDNVHKNCKDCIGYFMASRGSHLNEIIFNYWSEGLYFQIKNKFEKIFSRFFKAFSKKRYLAEPLLGLNNLKFEALTIADTFFASKDNNKIFFKEILIYLDLKLCLHKYIYNINIHKWHKFR